MVCTVEHSNTTVKLPLTTIWLTDFKRTNAIASSSKQSKWNAEPRDVMALVRWSKRTTHIESDTFYPPSANADDSIRVGDVLLNILVGLSHGDICLLMEPFQCHDDLLLFILGNRVLVIVVMCHANSSQALG